MFLEIILSKTVTFNLSQFGITKKKMSEPLHKKGSFALRISLVNVIISAASCGFAAFSKEILN